MAQSKSDLHRGDQKIARRIAELREKARLDPLKKNPRIHDELEKLLKKQKER